MTLFNSRQGGRTLLVLASIVLGFLQTNALPANVPAVTGAGNQVAANASEALNAEPPDPPLGWSITINPAPAPREPFQRSDIFVAGIEALYQLSLRPWSSHCPYQATFFWPDPQMRSDVRIQLYTVNAETKTAGAVWAIWNVMWWYHQHPGVNDEVVFQTTYNGRESLKGGFLSRDRGSESSNTVAVTKRTFNESDADSGLSDDTPADIYLPITNATPASSNVTDVVTVPALGGDPAMGCRRDSWWGLHLNPEDSYLAIGAMLRNIAPKSNAARVNLKIPVGPQIDPHEGTLSTIVIPSTNQLDWLRHWPITWHALKVLTRHLASYSASANYGRGGTAEILCYAVSPEGAVLTAMELVDGIRMSQLLNGSTALSTE